MQHLRPIPAKPPYRDVGHAAQRVAAVDVEPGGNEHDLRLELQALAGPTISVEGMQVICVVHPVDEGYIDRVALPVARAHLIVPPCPGVVGVLVRGDVEHRPVVVKAVLGAVPVVEVA